MRFGTCWVTLLQLLWSLLHFLRGLRARALIADFISSAPEWWTQKLHPLLLLYYSRSKSSFQREYKMVPKILTQKAANIVWKLLKMSHFNFWIMAFPTIFCPIKTDLSGNTVWPQASSFQKLVKMDHFWHFELTFVQSKCKRS